MRTPAAWRGRPPNGHTVACLRTGRPWFEDTRTGRRTTVAEPLTHGHFTWSPDSRWLLSSAGGVLRLWDPASGVQVARAALGMGENLLTALSAGSDRVYATGDSWALATLHRASLRRANSDVYLGAGVSALLPHPADGSVTVLKDHGSFVRVQPETGELLGSAPPGTLSDVDQVGALSPDGSLMAASDPNRNVRLLDLDTLKWIGADSHTPLGSDLSYAPDGSQFASVQPERIRLWDGRTGEYQASLPLPSLAAHSSISYLPDSSGLLVAATDGRTWRVNTRTSTWIHRACTTAGRNLTRTEWKQFFPTRPYEVACPQWPAGA